MSARRLTSALAAASLTLLVAGCSSTDRAQEEGFPLTPTEDAVVLDMPAGFADVAAACDGPTRIYVSAKTGYSGSTVAVVANDAACAGGGA